MAAAPGPGMDRWSQAECTAYEVGEGLATGPSLTGSTEDASKQSPGASSLRLLLLGKRGAGKSATGNSILGTAVFKSKFSGCMVTKSCQKASRVVRGREVTIIDTPDLFSSLASAEVGRCSLQQCLELSAPSLHALLLVIRIGHYTVDDEETIRGIRAEFGAKAMRHVVVVFTGEDELGKYSLLDYIESKDSLQALVREVGGGCCAFNNKADREQRDCQVDQLLGMIQHLVEKTPQPFRVNLVTEGSLCPACGHGAAQRAGKSPHGLKTRQLQTTGPEQNPEMRELKVLLVGKRGVGKSAAGNIILGKRVFETRFSRQSVTQTFQSERRSWRGKKVLVIDSPDPKYWIDNESELRKHAFPGPHAFLLVMPLGSSIKTDDMVFRTIKKSFGEKSTRHMIVLFTRKEDFWDQDINMFIERDEALCGLIKKFGNRFHSFSYRVTLQEEQSQVDELLQEVEDMAQKHGGKPCVFRDKETLNLILVGRSGTGKSATGNTILGRTTFVSRLRAQPVTEKCESDTTTVDGQDVVVVDTPSLHQMLAVHRDPSGVKEEVRRFCTEGFNIFVLVFPLGRFSEEDKREVEQLEHIFGEEIMKYVIVLFTRKEDLRDRELDDYIKSTDNKVLKNILKKCEKRACAFNNKETGSAQESQVRDLLTMANELRKSHDEYDYLYIWDYIISQIKKL